jgi:hypothetical protein
MGKLKCIYGFSNMTLTPVKFGLKAAFSKIEQLRYEVTFAGNPILMNLNQRYVVKGIGTEKEISSVVEIRTTEDESMIVKVMDKWDGEIPSGAIRNVSSRIVNRTSESTNSLLRHCAA